MFQTPFSGPTLCKLRSRRISRALASFVIPQVHCLSGSSISSGQAVSRFGYYKLPGLGNAAHWLHHLLISAVLLLNVSNLLVLFHPPSTLTLPISLSVLDISLVEYSIPQSVVFVFHCLLLPFIVLSFTAVIMKGVFGLSLLPLLAAASPVYVDSIHNNAAPVLTSVNAKDVPDSYIVVFKDHVTHDSAAAHHSWVQDIHSSQNERIELKKRSLFGFSDPDYLGMKHVFNVGDKFKGYAGHFHEDVIEQVRRHPDVSNTPSSLLTVISYRWASADSWVLFHPITGRLRRVGFRGPHPEQRP